MRSGRVPRPALHRVACRTTATSIRFALSAFVARPSPGGGSGRLVAWSIGHCSLSVPRLSRQVPAGPALIIHRRRGRDHRRRTRTTRPRRTWALATIACGELARRCRPSRELHDSCSRETFSTVSSERLLLKTPPPWSRGGAGGRQLGLRCASAGSQLTCDNSSVGGTVVTLGRHSGIPALRQGHLQAGVRRSLDVTSTAV